VTRDGTRRRRTANETRCMIIRITRT
jgi:hypothetical protein